MQLVNRTLVKQVSFVTPPLVNVVHHRAYVVTAVKMQAVLMVEFAATLVTVLTVYKLVPKVTIAQMVILVQKVLVFQTLEFVTHALAPAVEIVHIVLQKKAVAQSVDRPVHVDKDYVAT